MHQRPDPSIICTFSLRPLKRVNLVWSSYPIISAAVATSSGDRSVGNRLQILICSFTKKSTRDLTFDPFFPVWGLRSECYAGGKCCALQPPPPLFLSCLRPNSSVFTVLKLSWKIFELLCLTGLCRLNILIVQFFGFVCCLFDKWR